LNGTVMFFQLGGNGCGYVECGIGIEITFSKFPRSQIFWFCF